MSFADCIEQNPALQPRQKEQLINEYNDLFERYSETMGDTIAAAAAAKRYVEIQEKIIAKKNENIVRDALAWNQINGRIDTAAGKVKKQKEQAGKLKVLFGKSDVATATRSFLESVYTRQQAIERRATLAIGESIEKFRSKRAGLTQDTEGFIPVVRSLLGEKVDGDAASDGKAIREVFDNLHRMYEQSGGILGKLDNYFPQSHNPITVGRAGFENWKSFILPLLDRDKMVDMDTGLPMSGAKLDKALEDVYEGIRTNGLDEVAERSNEGKVTFGRKGGVSKRHSSSRFFHFKNADAYLEYSREFGYGESGLFDAMMGHIHNMTRDIALLQEMGPKPEAQIERLKLKIQTDKGAPQAIKTVDGMYDVLAGRTSYHGELPTWYRAIRGLQDWMRSSYLGSAPVSALSDTFYGAFTAKLNGVPATRTINQYLKLLNPVDNKDRRIARRIAFIAGAASGNSLRQARFLDDVGSRGLTGWLSSFTNRASGLASMTDSIQQSVVMSTQGFLSEARSTRLSWNKLPRAMQDAFERFDMGKQEYDEIMKSVPFVDEMTGADFIRPEDVASSGFGETATKYEMWLVDMGQSASNEPRLLARAITTGAILGDAREGTVLRSSASSLMMFKSFGVTVIMNHLLPSLRHMAVERGTDRLARIAPMLFGTTFLGMMAIQARQVLQGKEPKEFNEKLVGASMMQGGGFGIFGDFMFADYSRFNNGFLGTAAGPVPGFASDVARVFKGNFDRALDDDRESKFASDLYQLAERNVPAVRLWYTRLFLERMLLDQAERAIDPNFDRRMNNMEKRMQKDYGQKFWWRPGDVLPE